jgi:hypothetical protein
VMDDGLDLVAGRRAGGGMQFHGGVLSGDLDDRSGGSPEKRQRRDAGQPEDAAELRKDANVTEMQ